MSRTAHLRLPFFDAQHRAFADELDEWAVRTVAEVEGGAPRNPLAGEGMRGMSTRSAGAGSVHWAPPDTFANVSRRPMAARTTRCNRSIW